MCFVTLVLFHLFFILIYSGVKFDICSDVPHGSIVGPFIFYLYFCILLAFQAARLYNQQLTPPPTKSSKHGWLKTEHF